MNIYNKQPGDQLDYDVEFDNWMPDGDEITTVEVFLDKVGELVIDQYQKSGLIVKVWLSGGISGCTYKVTVRVATAGARIKETEFKLRVREL